MCSMAAGRPQYRNSHRDMPPFQNTFRRDSGPGSTILGVSEPFSRFRSEDALHEGDAIVPRASSAFCKRSDQIACADSFNYSGQAEGFGD